MKFHKLTEKPPEQNKKLHIKFGGDKYTGTFNGVSFFIIELRMHYDRSYFPIIEWLDESC